MRSQRSPGEIINATLLEIFLSFIFVVLTVAWLKTKESDEWEGRYQNVVSAADSARIYRDSATVLNRRLATLRDSIRGAFPPFCQKAYLARITLLSSDEWLIESLHAAQPWLQEGDVFTISAGAFSQRFAAVRAYEFGKGKCRYRVQIRDTDAVGKVAWQRAWDIVANTFYVAQVH